MFIEIALRDLSPAATMTGRLLFAFSALGTILAARRGPRQAVRSLRQFGWPGVVLGVITTALPFWLIAWGQTRIDSGIAAIANASMPIFVALLAIRYAAGSLYSQHKLGDSSGLLVSTASVFWGFLAILPFGIAQRPDAFPGWEAIAAAAALGLLGTAVGLLLYLYLLEHHGAARGSLVVYLLPPAALVYGAVFLDEPIRLTALVGLALILVGVALGSGLVRPMRRR